MRYRHLLLLLFALLLLDCKPAAPPVSPDPQTPVPSEVNLRAFTATPATAVSTPPLSDTPSAPATHPPPTPARSAVPTMNPDFAATQAAMSQGTRWAMTYPTAAGTPDPYNLIEAALLNSEIDIDHASVYRLYALFASPGLPKRYQSPRLIQADGLGAYMFAMKDFDRVSPATQRFLGIFVTPREITIVPTAVHPSTTPSPTFFPHGLYSLTLDKEVHPGALPLAGRWRMDQSSLDEARFWLCGKLVVTRLYRTIGNHIEFFR
jgi:hypothetical protein